MAHKLLPFSGFCLSCLLALGLHILYKRRHHTLPPGPNGWPLFGYLPCLTRPTFEELKRLQQVYGDVVCFYLFGRLVVVLNSFQAIHEAGIVNYDAIGRYTMFVNDILAKRHGISNYNGVEAMQLRKSLIRHLSSLRNDDETRQKECEIEKNIRDETTLLAEELRAKNGYPVLILPLLRRTVWRIIWKIVFGKPCALTDEQIFYYSEQIGLNNDMNKFFHPRQLLPTFCVTLFTNFAAIRRLFGISTMCQRYTSVCEMLRNETSAELQNGLPPQSLLRKITTELQWQINAQNTQRLLFELIAAGTDTTALSLTWACHLLALSDGRPSRLDLDQVHRFASVVPLGLPHIAKRTLSIRGYIIPKDSVIIYNLYAIHQEQLSAMRNPMNQSSQPVPFSIGARSCPGKYLATKVLNSIFHILTEQFIVRQLPTEQGQAVARKYSTGGLTRAPASMEFIFLPCEQAKLEAVTADPEDRTL